jgi:poly(A) polymerase
MLTRVFPELEDTRGCEQPENYHPEGDVFVHTILTVEKLDPHPDFVTAMASLLHDIGKPEASRRGGPKRFPEHERIGAEMACEVCRRLRLPRAETERICWLVKRHMYLQDAARMKDSTLKRLFAEPGFEQLLEIHRADALASWGNLDHIEHVIARKRQMGQEDINPPALISGHDLIERGYKPGPALGEILEAVREMQLQGELADREAALGAAERIACKIGAPRR